MIRLMERLMAGTNILMLALIKIHHRHQTDMPPPLIILQDSQYHRLESGKTDTPKLKHDLKKLITSLGIAEVVYTIVRWALQY